MAPTPYRAFTVKSNGHADRIMTRVGVRAAFDPAFARSSARKHGYVLNNSASLAPRRRACSRVHTARWHLSPRISIGPEVTFDFLAPRNGIPGFTPFVVVGGGLFRTSEGFANRPPFSATEGTFTLGGGIRAPLTERVGAGIDARLGWEPHLRITGFVSVALGGTR